MVGEVAQLRYRTSSGLTQWDCNPEKRAQKSLADFNNLSQSR
jgi:hypothetical protein